RPAHLPAVRLPRGRPVPPRAADRRAARGLRGSGPRAGHGGCIDNLSTGGIWESGQQPPLILSASHDDGAGGGCFDKLSMSGWMGPCPVAASAALRPARGAWDPAMRACLGGGLSALAAMYPFWNKRRTFHFPTSPTRVMNRAGSFSS